MKMTDLIGGTNGPAAWSLGDNIPWNQPGFSKRMLREHLSPDHDLASRRGPTIDQQVAWIHEHLLGGVSARVLDLGCGPGLYGKRLAERGHAYVGIDYSPASIAHARKLCADVAGCKFVHADMRAANFGTGYDLVMMLYGEFNVFRPADVGLILDKMHESLAPGGTLLLEPHTMAAVVAIGAAPRTWDALGSGLFSDRPHLYLQQGHWDEQALAATGQFIIVDAQTGDVSVYAASYQAYSDDEYRALLDKHGFCDIAFHKSLTGQDESAHASLTVIRAQKNGGPTAPD